MVEHVFDDDLKPEYDLTSLKFAKLVKVGEDLSSLTKTMISCRIMIWTIQKPNLIVLQRHIRKA